MLIKKVFIIIFSITVVISCSERDTQIEDNKSNPIQTIGHIDKLDPTLEMIVPSGAVLEILASGHDWTEGPVWIPVLKSILYSDIPKNAIFRWQEGKGASVWLKPSGFTGEVQREGESGSNGLILDLEGRLLLAQHGDRRIARLEAPWKSPQANYSTLADKYDGKKFNSPNDIAVRSNGDIYFTDPPYGLEHGIEDPAKELDIQGVYRLAVDGSVTLVTDILSRPNGIAFSPDERTLYVANSDEDQAVIMAYDVQADGRLANDRVFFDTWGDGMTVDQEGNVYATGSGGVLVISPAGKHLGTLMTTQATSNCTFGDDGSTLYITADMYLLRIRLNMKGIGF
jgi:gluconolactonase